MFLYKTTVTAFTAARYSSICNNIPISKECITIYCRINIFSTALKPQNVYLLLRLKQKSGDVHSQ